MIHLDRNYTNTVSGKTQIRILANRSSSLLIQTCLQLQSKFLNVLWSIRRLHKVKQVEVAVLRVLRETKK